MNKLYIINKITASPTGLAVACKTLPISVGNRVFLLIINYFKFIFLKNFYHSLEWFFLIFRFAYISTRHEEIDFTIFHFHIIQSISATGIIYLFMDLFFLTGCHTFQFKPNLTFISSAVPSYLCFLFLPLQLFFFIFISFIISQ